MVIGMKKVIKIKDILVFFLLWITHISLLSGAAIIGYMAGEAFATNHSVPYLRISSVSPSLMKGELGQDGIVKVSFTEQLMGECVKARNFFIKEGNFRIPVRLKYDKNRKIVTIVPKEELESGKEYTFHIGGGVVSTKNHRGRNRLIKRFVVRG